MKRLGFAVLLVLALLGFIPKAQAATYYVSQSGTNGSCAAAQAIAAAKTTIAAGLACLSAGDTLLINDGTYAAGISDAIPSGIDVNRPTTVKAINARSVVLNGVSSTPGIVVILLDRNFITLDGLDVDCVGRAVGILIGTNTGGPNPGSSYVTVKNGKVHGCRGGTSGSVTSNGTAGTTNASDHLTFQNLEIYDNSGAVPQGMHGIYVPFNFALIEDCDIHHNDGWGIHQYGAGGIVSNAIFRRNRVHDNGDWGILLGSGPANAAYNNLVYGNNTKASLSSGGISVDFGASDAEVYSNTIYGNAVRGIGLGFNSTVSNTTIQNNIILNNAATITDKASVGTVSDHNVTVDPGFVMRGSPR